MRRFLIALLLLAAAERSWSATVLVLQFHNNSNYADLNWVGESIADTLMKEFAGANEIVLDRAVRAGAIRRLSLRPSADYTKATLIHIGQSLDADYLCFGTFDISLPFPQAPLKESSIRIATQFIDLRKLHDGPEMSEAGRLSELSRLEEHLSYESLKYLQPQADLQIDRFLSPQKAFRLDAEESYVRGLLSTSREQKQKWFLQAAALDSKFTGPAFELGRIALEQKQFPQAVQWFRRIGPADPNFPEARFKMGLAAYGAADYSSAATYFREVVKSYPLSEVFNNLGAAESNLNQPAAGDDFRHALETDPENPGYLFNLGLFLLKNNNFEDAAQRFQQVLKQQPNDQESRALVDQARRREPASPGTRLPSQRLKTGFNEIAFRQLKAMLQSGATR